MLGVLRRAWYREEFLAGANFFPPAIPQLRRTSSVSTTFRRYRLCKYTHGAAEQTFH
jgi:hypothetical protein